jgi:hypothetical protein
LVNDCKAVVQGFKTGKYTTNNLSKRLRIIIGATI